MGCFNGTPEQEYKPPVQESPKRASPPPPTREEIERQQREAEEDKKWYDIAAEKNPPPFPKPAFAKGGSQEEYKEFMQLKFQYEAWMNSNILLGRKLRKEAQTTPL